MDRLVASSAEIIAEGMESPGGIGYAMPGIVRSRAHRLLWRTRVPCPTALISDVCLWGGSPYEPRPCYGTSYALI